MNKHSGFTLVELLVSLGLLGVILTTLFQTMGSTTQLANTTNSSNDLIREGQIAQQVLNARFKEACYVYPANKSIQLAASGYTTKNGIGSPVGSNWVINTHPMVAMILPPSADIPATLTVNNYRFVAYYAIPRSQYVAASPAGAANVINPGPDVLNDSVVWMLMEYRQNINVLAAGFGLVTTCAAVAANTSTVLTGGNAELLTDFITPVTTSTQLFNVGPERPDGSASFVEYNLRLQKTTRGNGTTNTITVGGGASGTTLTAKVYPVNLGL